MGDEKYSYEFQMAIVMKRCMEIREELLSDLPRYVPLFKFLIFKNL